MVFKTTAIDHSATSPYEELLPDKRLRLFVILRQVRQTTDPFSANVLLGLSRKGSIPRFITSDGWRIRGQCAVAATRNRPDGEHRDKESVVTRIRLRCNRDRRQRGYAAERLGTDYESDRPVRRWYRQEILPFRIYPQEVEGESQGQLIREINGERNWMVGPELADQAGLERQQGDEHQEQQVDADQDSRDAPDGV